MPDDKPKATNEEENYGLPANWIPVDAPPVVPGTMAPTADGSIRYLQGSLPPTAQHDISFTATAYKQDRTPQLTLMPLSPSGDASTNSGVQSVVQKIIEQTGSSGLVLETNGNLNSSQLLLDLEAGTGVTLSNANGRTTISSTATSTPALPLPNTALYFMARAFFQGATLQTIGAATTGTSSAGSGAIVGSGTAPTANDGVILEITTGASNNSIFGFLPVNGATPATMFRAGRNNRYQCRARFPTVGDLSNARIWYGMTDKIPTSMNSSTPAGANIAAFLFTGPNWTCVIAQAGVYTTLGSGVAGDTVSHSFDITMDDTANTTTFSIDGVSVGVISGKNPTGLNWFPTYVVGNTAAATVNQNLEYFYAQQDF